MRRTAPLIVGGGPAGSATAITLVRGGAAPTILERNRETGDALCGGFLSWRTLDTLESLGVDNLGGHMVTQLRLFAGKTRAEARLPHRAMGLSRLALDSRLIAHAESLGCPVERGLAARSYNAGGVETSDGATLNPETIFLATGKHDLRGLPRPHDPDQTLGIRVRLAPSPALSRLCGETIELHLFERGYCGIVLQEGGRGNLCLAVRKSRLADAGGDPTALLTQWAAESPAFAERMAFAEGAPDAIGAVPYGWIARDTTDGIYRLGDQAAVIPSLAGEGNGIALASGMMAAQSWLSGKTASEYQKRFARAAYRPIWVARQIWHLSERPGSARMMVRLAALAPMLAAHLAGQTRIGR